MRLATWAGPWTREGGLGGRCGQAGAEFAPWKLQAPAALPPPCPWGHPPPAVSGRGHGRSRVSAVTAQPRLAPAAQGEPSRASCLLNGGFLVRPSSFL